MRSRYGNYLSPSYNLSEIYIRSTDSTRTKMSVLAAMAALYRPDGNGLMKDINWEPVPYTTVPLQNDFLMGMNCPRFVKHFDEVTNNYVPEMEKYSDVIHRLSAELDQNLESAPVKIFFAYDVFVSQTNLGLPVKQSIQEMMSDIKRASDTAFDIIYGNDTMLPLQAGLLLKEFFDVSSDAITGKSSQKVRIYSAHDTNVYAFEAISKATPRQGVPPYSAFFALELRKVVDTGRYVVVPIYVSSPGKPVQYLQIEGCGPLCDIEKFYEITAPYLLDLKEWKRRCNHDQNAPFNTRGYE